MGINNKILYLIIAVTFVGGLFSAAYAGPVLNTITLGGNTVSQGTMTAENYFDNGNTQTGTGASALGGINNQATGSSSTVGGGTTNTASGPETTISGGSGNDAEQIGTTIGGGKGNNDFGSLFNEFYATIGGGQSNTANADRATIGGGGFNMATGFGATIPGGDSNLASGDYSFAAGRAAKATHDGAFVFADSTGVPFSSTADNQFSIRATGGVLIEGDLDMTRGQISNLNEPTSPSDAATKNYVDTNAIIDPSTQAQLDNIETETDKIQMVKDDVGTIMTETDKIQMVKDNQYVPFLKTASVTKTCDKPGGGPGFTTITLTSAKGKTFMVNSFVIIPGVTSINQAADSIKLRTIDFISAGSNLFIGSDDLTGSDTGRKGIEVLGASASLFNTKIPLQVANFPGFPLVFGFDCNASTTNDLLIDSLRVVGWKAADDTISVS